MIGRDSLVSVTDNSHDGNAVRRAFRRGGRRIACALLALACGVACTPQEVPFDREETAKQVLADLREFEAQLNAAEYDAALGFYADDPMFAAYEDGQLLYPTWNMLKNAFATLPNFGKGVFRYDEAEVVVFDADHAHLSTRFWTSFGEEGQPGYVQFDGMMTAAMVRGSSRWQLLRIHASTLNRTPGRPSANSDAEQGANP